MAPSRRKGVAGRRRKMDRPVAAAGAFHRQSTSRPAVRWLVVHVYGQFAAASPCEKRLLAAGLAMRHLEIGLDLGFVLAANGASESVVVVVVTTGLPSPPSVPSAFRSSSQLLLVGGSRGYKASCGDKRRAEEAKQRARAVLLSTSVGKSCPPSAKCRIQWPHLRNC